MPQSEVTPVYNTVLKGIAIFVLLAALVIVGLLSLLTFSYVPIVIGIVTLVAGMCLYKWRLHSKLKASHYTCILLSVAILLVGVSCQIGASPRSLSRQEWSDILIYLEIQYPGQDFRIVSGRVEHVTQWGILGSATRRWSEIEAVAADSDGVRFEVIGRNDDSRLSGSRRLVQVNTLMLRDYYTMMPQRFPILNMEDEIWEIVRTHHHLFYDSSLAGRHSEISLVPLHIEVKMTINFNDLHRDDFDESTAVEVAVNIRDEIRAATGIEQVSLRTTFLFSNQVPYVWHSYYSDGRVFEEHTSMRNDRFVICVGEECLC